MRPAVVQKGIVGRGGNDEMVKTGESSGGQQMVYGQVMRMGRGVRGGWSRH